jgi:DNA-binding NarL/FixJ family response regulator
MSEIRIALVDEHVMVREALVGHLERLEEDFQVVAQLDDGPALMEYLSAREGPVPHVAVIAVWLQNMGGILTTQRLSQYDRRIRVVGLTEVHSPEVIYQMCRAGAYTCLHKSRAIAELIAAIRAARYGGDHHDPETKRIADEYERRFNAFPTLTGLSPKNGPAKMDLTRREFSVLQCLCQAHSNTEIAETLGISTRTVQTHLTHIYSKMKVRGRNEAIIKAFRNHWVFPSMPIGWEAIG